MLKINGTSSAFLAFACALSIAISGCKKEDDTPPPGTPTFSQGLISKVTMVESGDSTSYRLRYGTDELVDTIFVSVNGVLDHAKVFQHLPGLVVATVPAFGAGVWVDSTWLDNAGHPTRTRKNLGGFVTEFRYLYNSRGELTHFINQQPGSSGADTTWNVWSNGNLVASYNFFGDSTHYHYNVSRDYQRGEPRHIATLLEIGRNTVPGKNLQTGFSREGATLNYSFEYDGDDRITRTSGGGSTSFQAIEY